MASPILYGKELSTIYAVSAYFIFQKRRIFIMLVHVVASNFSHRRN